MRLLALLLLTGGIGSCDFSIGCGTDRPPAAAAEPSATTGVPHGDHSPHHGGVVMMKGDLHYEIVLEPSGRYRLYFTDAARADLPASTAVRASLTVVRSGDPPEGVELQIDEAGESWIGQGQPVQAPATTTARVAYTIRGEEPYWIDLPFVAQTDPNAPDPHRKP